MQESVLRFDTRLALAGLATSGRNTKLWYGKGSAVRIASIHNYEEGWLPSKIGLPLNAINFVFQVSIKQDWIIYMILGLAIIERPPVFTITLLRLFSCSPWKNF